MQNVPTLSFKKGLRFSLLQVLLGFDCYGLLGSSFLLQIWSSTRVLIDLTPDALDVSNRIILAFSSNMSNLLY
jgi:hypothetical protein